MRDLSALARGLFTHSPVPYIVFDAQGHPLATNRAYREMFGAEPPRQYCVLADEVLERKGLMPLVRRAFEGETLETPVFWYDPKELGHISVTEAHRVAIACSFFPLQTEEGARQIAVAFKDVTAEYEARTRAEEERARAEAERIAFARRSPKANGWPRPCGRRRND